ncbi:glutaredoxin 3 [Methylophaga pinxianii]|uniref:glutaredoxin 3 n=1 Tax=Methylophaga pinxianii TaxID=2881052 RepID=UPI001CF0F68F|nr:glutaredoxin 3 [Methylophaga pinxianii]MCB2428178.1 glutaredoxin 3 [Methylophaga pinxianii]UPH45936.1 glutaredoxin 3 [Methylophaga pinxianii]
MSKIIVYSSAHCPYCTMAKQLLDRKGLSYDEIRVDQHPEKREEMMQKSQRRTVPQIFVNGNAVGGFTDLVEIDRSGQLDALLAKN